MNNYIWVHLTRNQSKSTMITEERAIELYNIHTRNIEESTQVITSTKPGVVYIIYEDENDWQNSDLITKVALI